MARRRPARKKRSRWGCGCLAVVLALAALASYFAWKAWTWPDVAALARENPRTTAFIEEWRAERRAGGKKDVPDRRWVEYGAISNDLKAAVLVAEDINFFSHHGFETAEMENAIREAIEEKELPRGASTITQQLAKNLWLSPSRNPVRKVEEAILTRQLERTLSKRRILEIYLNVVELGEGIYGAEAGARRYFGKAASELTEEEAAELAASLPAPDEWHPGSTSRAYRRHVETVLRRLRKAEWVRREVE